MPQEISEQNNREALTDLKGARWLTSAPLAKVFAAFKKGGFEVRVVGGAVRNALLGLPVSDVDLATTAHPADVERIGKAAGLSVHPTGLEHGTMTVVADGVSFEITTLRRDVETDGRHAVVAYSDNWTEDAQRRDFTINALYATQDGAIFDPTGGQADLAARKVRFIGNAEARIREDYLRILRFFRFSAFYGEGRLDPEGLAAAIKYGSKLSTLSGERIGAELLKLLVAPQADAVVGVMCEAHIFDALFVGTLHPARLAKLGAVERHCKRPPNAIARLAALFLDGTERDADIAAQITKCLRLKNADVEELQRISKSEPTYEPSTSEHLARVALYRLGAETWSNGALIAWARSSEPADDLARRYRLELAQRWQPPVLPLRGGDLISLGIPPGPRIGEILRAFEAWWLSADFSADSAMQQRKIQALIKQS